MTDLWDTVEEAEPDWSIRSRIRYPDPDPEGTAAMYARFRQERLERREAESEVDESQYEWVISDPAREFDDPCGPLATYVKLLVKHGWSLAELAHSAAWRHQPPVATGENAGRERPDEHVERQWVYATRGSDRLVVSYELTGVYYDKVRGNQTVRRINGVNYSDAEMKAKIKT